MRRCAADELIGGYPGESDVEITCDPSRRMAEQAKLRVGFKKAAVEALAEPSHTAAVSVLALGGQFARLPESHDQGRRGACRPLAPVPVPPPVIIRLQVHAGTDVECTRALRAVDLVCGKAEQVDVPGVDVDG